MKLWHTVVGVAIGIAIAVAGAWVQTHLTTEPLPAPSHTTPPRQP